MKRIQTKITLTFAILTLLAISTFAFFASIATERSLTQQKVSGLSQRLDALVPVLEKESHKSPAELADLASEFSRVLNVRITLIDSTGVVLLDSDIPPEKLSMVENHLDRPEIRRALKDGFGADTRTSATIGKDFLYVAKTVAPFAAGKRTSYVRFVRLSVYISDIKSIAADQRNTILLAGAIVLALVTAASLIVSRRIAGPIEEIGKAVQEIRAGNLETRINIRSDDEIGSVARAVNEMVGTLKADIVNLQRLEQVRTEFLGNVSHELRTPIFSLQGFLETLIDGAVDDPAVNREFLKKALSHSNRLNVLLGDLITISQIESGEMKMSFRYFNLHEFLTTVIDELKPTAALKSVSLSLSGAALPDLDVLGDKERLYVAMENLLENAIKYNKPDGEVLVSYERENGKVNIHVADTGVGVPDEHRSRIFERFYRIDRNRSREVGGTGLGLAIVKHIIEAHGSHVNVESETGKGSTFSFSLKTS